MAFKKNVINEIILTIVKWNLLFILLSKSEIAEKSYFFLSFYFNHVLIDSISIKRTILQIFMIIISTFINNPFERKKNKT